MKNRKLVKNSSHVASLQGVEIFPSRIHKAFRERPGGKSRSKRLSLFPSPFLSDPQDGCNETCSIMNLHINIAIFSIHPFFTTIYFTQTILPTDEVYFIEQKMKVFLYTPQNRTIGKHFGEKPPLIVVPFLRQQLFPHSQSGKKSFVQSF